MTSRPTTRDWLLFGLLSLFWGSSYLFIKIGIETLAPFTLVACRLFFGAWSSPSRSRSRRRRCHASGRPTGSSWSWPSSTSSCRSA